MTYMLSLEPNLASNLECRADPSTKVSSSSLAISAGFMLQMYSWCVSVWVNYSRAIWG